MIWIQAAGRPVRASAESAALGAPAPEEPVAAADRLLAFELHARELDAALSARDDHARLVREHHGAGRGGALRDVGHARGVDLQRLAAGGGDRARPRSHAAYVIVDGA